jgi:hypothetical protein
MHPTVAHVVPAKRSSISNVFAPACRAARSAAKLAVPAPTMAASHVMVMRNALMIARFLRFLFGRHAFFSAPACERNSRALGSAPQNLEPPLQLAERCLCARLLDARLPTECQPQIVKIPQEE